jgi:hypothetical protein
LAEADVAFVLGLLLAAEAPLDGSVECGASECGASECGAAEEAAADGVGSAEGVGSDDGGAELVGGVEWDADGVADGVCEVGPFDGVG